MLAWSISLDRTLIGNQDRGMILHGLRGVGKTVLLKDLAGTARDRGWDVAELEAESSAGSFRADLSRALLPVIRNLARPGALGRLKRLLQTFRAFTLKVDPEGAMTLGLDLETDSTRASTGDEELDTKDLLTDVCDLLSERKSGLVLMIDEIQQLDKHSLAAVAAMSHLAGQRNLPFLVAGAGLPNVPGALASARPYAERLYDYRMIDKLGPAEARQALEVAARSAGARWDQQAVRYVASQAEGYPYFLQEFGRACWDIADRSPITQANAYDGVSRGWASLDVGFYQSRWDRATPAERSYMEAMAGLGGRVVNTGSVADRLSKSTQSLQPARSGLIGKGLIYAPEVGVVAFTVPGMPAFIERLSRRR